MRNERTAWALTLTGLIPFAGAALVLTAVGGVWAGPAAVVARCSAPACSCAESSAQVSTFMPASPPPAAPSGCARRPA